MGAIENEKAYAILIRESATDGSDFSNPPADYRVAFLGEDGLWHVKDSAGAVTDPFSGSGAVATDAIWDAKGDLAGGTGANTAARLAVGANGTILMAASGEATGLKWAIPSKVPTIARLASGDVTISATTAVVGSVVTGLSNITLAAVTGDYIEIGLSCRIPNTTAQSIKFDVATIVSAAIVNFVSSLTNTAAGSGVPGWYGVSAVINKAMGSIVYVAQAGDLSGGNIVLSLICWASASTRAIGSSSTDPLVFWARNLGQ